MGNDRHKEFLLLEPKQQREAVLDSFGSYLPDWYIEKLERMIMSLMEGNAPTDTEYQFLDAFQTAREEEDANE